MDLRNTLKLTHQLLEQNSITHALIGGLALACHGSTRATIDLDLIIHEDDKLQAKELLLRNGFNLVYESVEIMQFDGLGYVDILLARRPLAQSILINAQDGGPEGIRFIGAEDLIGLKIQAYNNDSSRELQDKADIQFLIETHKNLNFEKIKEYADLFNRWEDINEIRNKIKF